MNGAQLKNSILQWAIQGKLVPQNPKDEPAQKLLERIAASRNGDVSPWSEAIGSTACHPERNAVKSKDLKKKKPAPTSRIYRENGVWYEQVGSATPKDISDEIPFEIPETWAWCRLAQLAEIQSSKRVFEKDYVTTGIPFFRSKEIGELSRGESIHTELYITKQHYKELKEKYGVPQVGDILLTSVGSIGNLWICDGREFYYKDGNVTQICSNSSFDSQYVALYLSSPLFFEQIRSSVAGTAYNALTIIKLKSLILPLPPLAEQKRIVAKLEQVLPLAEEYGAAQEQLDKLNKELPDALKKSILQEAIQGKLVHQNPKDEPAQKLLERITVARSESSQPKGAKSKKSTPTSRIYCENGTWYEQIGNAEPKDISEDIPFEIPKNWTWCRLNSICDYLHRGKSPSYSDKKILPVMAQKCNQWDRIYTEKCLFADPKTLDRYLPEHFLQLGDVLINSTGGGTVGRTGYVDEYVFSDYDKFVADSHVTVVRSNKNICSKYVYYFLITPLIQTGIEERCSGSTNQIELGTETIKNYLIPLPPLAEQKRIVTKLEQLFKVL